MIKDIIDRLALLIDSVYPDIPYCEMQDVQGVEPPRFFIKCYRTELTPRIYPAGFFHTCNFDLVFDPGAEGGEDQCNRVAFKLVPIIQKIPREDGTNYRSDNINTQYDSNSGVLHIYFDVTSSFHEETGEDIPDILRIHEQTHVEVV